MWQSVNEAKAEERKTFLWNERIKIVRARERITQIDEEFVVLAENEPFPASKGETVMESDLHRIFGESSSDDRSILRIPLDEAANRNGRWVWRYEWGIAPYPNDGPRGYGD